MLNNINRLRTLKSIKQILGQYQGLVVVFLLAALSPFMLWLILSPDKLSLGSRADAQNELRLWFEPGTVITTPNTPTKVSVMASFLADRELVPQLGVQLFVDAHTPVSINPTNITYQTPFNGRTKIGEVEIISTAPGTYTVTLSDQVATTYSKPLRIQTAPLTIIVQ
ncbi:MAG: hypothetical protein AAB874_00750, partial [Patescibacteria group bacterium]